MKKNKRDKAERLHVINLPKLTGEFMNKKLEALKAQINEQFGVSAYTETKKYYINNHYYTTDRLDIANNIDDVEFSDELIRHELGRLIEESGTKQAKEEQNEIMCEVTDELYESLFYWLIYFKPTIESVSTAIECNLVPFHFQGEFYLALGGCGMDLSPKLDAYQALTGNSIPERSCVFNDAQYFSYVVGEKMMKKTLKACKRDKKLILISFNI